MFSFGKKCNLPFSSSPCLGLFCNGDFCCVIESAARFCTHGQQCQQVQANKQTTTTPTIIHCIITFVGSYYSKDFLLITNVINPCKRNGYYMCGKSCVTFVVGRLITLNAADFDYICGLLRLWTLLHWWALKQPFEEAQGQYLLSCSGLCL